MKQMNTSGRMVIALSLLLITTLGVSGCSLFSSSSTDSSDIGSSVEEKVGNTIKTGVVSQAGESYFLTEPGKTPAEIDSYAIDLAQYVGKSVTVTGQYSGDTLFVGAIEIQK